MILLSYEFSKKYLILDKKQRERVENLINQIGKKGNSISVDESQYRYFIFDGDCRVYYRKAENDFILLDFKFRGDLVT